MINSVNRYSNSSIYLKFYEYKVSIKYVFYHNIYFLSMFKKRAKTKYNRYFGLKFGLANALNNHLRLKVCAVN